MILWRRSIWGACLALGLGGCVGQAQQPASTAAPDVVAPSAAPAPQPEDATPFNPVTTTLELMQTVMVYAAEDYWDSVQVTVDENGVTEHAPQTDDEWDRVRAAALMVAESGNLLLMPPRMVDNRAWTFFSRQLTEAGVEAAAAAAAHDVDRVFAAGEQIYNVCVACHTRYIR